MVSAERMLKDYLRDDLSSCSSSGFKSFPRRQCCTTVRFLLEIDMKSNCDYSDSKRALIKKSRSRSALQKASSAVLNAVKHLQFSSSSGESLSRKLSFWKRRDRDEGEGETGRSKLFGDFLGEIEQPSKSDLTSSAAVTAETITPHRSRVSTSSWSESKFTGGYSENCCGNEVKGDSAAEEIGNRVGATDGEDSVNGGKVKWQNEAGKEQFSPVSILENPFHDDEDENNSPFQDQEIMQKSRRFPSIADIKPLDLEKKCIEFFEAEDLFEILKGKIRPNNLNADFLILDFFRERIGGEFEMKLVEKAEGWFNGRFEEAILGWEVVEGRKLYLGGEWKSLEEERAEVAAEMEVEVLDLLVEELLSDF